MILGDLGQDVDLRFRAGAFELRTVRLQGVDLTGATVKTGVKKRPRDTQILGELTVEVLSASAAESVFTLDMSPELQALLTAGEEWHQPASTYVWDAVIVDTQGRPHPLMKGRIFVQWGAADA